jgi:hypothetical protein
MEVGGRKRSRWGFAFSSIETDRYIRIPILDDISGLPIHDKYYYECKDCKLKKINKNFKRHRCAPYLDRVNRVAAELQAYTRGELGAIHQQQIQTDMHETGDNEHHARRESFPPLDEPIQNINPWLGVELIVPYGVQRHDDDDQNCMISLLGQVVNTVDVGNTTNYILEIRNRDGDEVLEQVMHCKGHHRGVLAKKLCS